MSEGPAGRPNFVIIMSDQHNARIMGCAGDPVVRTPNLDRLARSGVRFTGAYCAAPLCNPSRTAFLTSLFPSDTGVWTNAGVLSPHVPTFLHALALAGYETVLCGRMHLRPDQDAGFERYLVGEVGSGKRPAGGLFEGKIPPETVGQKYLTMSAVGPGRSAYIAYDDDVTRRAVEFITARTARAPERPLCLIVGLLLPHCPYICPKELFEEYMDRVTLPEVPPGYEKGLHPALRRWRATRGVEKITPEQARKARAAYCGLVTYMDARIGEVLGALDAAGMSENTVVAYLSDHGEMAGEHGMWWKDSFYEGASGVPMIWRIPGRAQLEPPAGAPAGSEVHSVVSLVDVGPTLLDLAGAGPLPHVRGRSLRPFLESGEAPSGWPDEAFAETYTAGQRPARMIRSGPWKLNAYHGYDRPQLFHLPSDPGELRDLGESPEHAEVRERLWARVHADWSGARVEEQAARADAGRRVLDAWRRQVRPAERERWDVPAGCNVFPEL